MHHIYSNKLNKLGTIEPNIGVESNKLFNRKGSLKKVKKIKKA